MMGFGSSPLELMATDAALRGQCFLQNFTYAPPAWTAGTATGALGANATVEGQMQVNTDADFVAQEMNIVAYSAAATIRANPDYLLLMTVAGSSRQLMTAAQPVTNLCGGYQDNRFPGRLPMPFLLLAGTTLTFTLQNRTANAENFVGISLRGFKVFYQSGNRQQIFHMT